MSDFITNAELRIESERLCDENERLEAENAELRHDLEEANNQAEEVCIENAKLGELVRDMFGAYKGTVEMLPSSYSKNVAEMAVMDISDRMRGLGVDE